MPGLVRHSRILNTLNEILVFDLSLAIWSIRTNQLRGNSYGHSTSWYQPKLFLTSATERRAPDWTGTPARLGLLPAAYATCRCAMGDGPRPLRHRI